MNKDWIGTKDSAFKTLGASNHSTTERHVEDFYATPPKALEMLLDFEKFNTNIWECACGQGHLSKVLEYNNYNVKSTDLIDRGYGEPNINFLKINEDDYWHGDIVTNPPYSYALEFIEKSLKLIPRGNKIAMFLKLQFLEGKKRRLLFLSNPPKTIYVSSSRLLCAKNGNFDNKYDGGAVAYAWYIWEKGFKGNTTLHWFN